MMAHNDIGSLMVIENENLVGKLTFREILNFIGKNFDNFSNLLVKDVMSSNPMTVKDDIGIDEVRKIMIENHIRYLPVTDEKINFRVLFHSTILQKRHLKWLIMKTNFSKDI